MATSTYTTSGAGWTEVTAAGSAKTDDFILQNTSIDRLILHFAATAPAADADGFVVEHRQQAIRAGVVGKVWIRSADGTTPVKAVCAGAV